MSKSPWINIGAKAERAETEERESAEKAATVQPPQFAMHPSPTYSGPAGNIGADSERADAEEREAEEKTEMTLQDFARHPSPTSSGPASSRDLTHQETLGLPTGLEKRSADNMQPGVLGGGVSRFGARPESGVRVRDYDGRRFGGYQDDDLRGGSLRVPEIYKPSREDENWSLSEKDFSVPYPRFSGFGSGYSRMPNSFGAARLREEVLAEKGLDGKNLQQSVVGGSTSKIELTMSESRMNEKPKEKGLDWKIDQIEEENLKQSVVGGSTRKSEMTVGESSMNEKPKVDPFGIANPFRAARPREEVLANKGLDGYEIEETNLQHSVGGGSTPTSLQSSRSEIDLVLDNKQIESVEGSLKSSRVSLSSSGVCPSTNGGSPSTLSLRMYRRDNFHTNLIGRIDNPWTSIRPMSKNRGGIENTIEFSVMVRDFIDYLQKHRGFPDYKNQGDPKPRYEINLRDNGSEGKMDWFCSRSETLDELPYELDVWWF